MRSCFYCLIAVILLHSSVARAQTDISISRKSFKTDKPGFKEAWECIGKGDSYYVAGGIWYAKAFDEYLQAIVYNPSNPELNYKTGVSALFSDRKEEAAGFLLKALEVKNNVTPDILLLTGRALQYAGRYSEAIEKFEGYLNSAGKKSEDDIAVTKRCIGECNSALLVTKDTMKIEITNLGGSINTSADEYSLVISSDGNTLYFASRRELPKSSNFYPDSKFDENIFISRYVNGSWEMAAIAGKALVTPYCETPLFLNSTGDILYVYSGFQQGGDIKMSQFKKGEWKTPEDIPFGINSGGSETSFTITPSGSEIYYVTDDGRKSIGGKDIYFIKKLSDRKWSKPQNAGTVINTLLDEESVRFSKSGDTLWFSSKGHNSIGGYDVFYSIRNAEGVWDSVKNCGYPVNTPWDDMFYAPSPVDRSLFYFVSNRNGGLGRLDLYQGRIIPADPVLFAEPSVLPAADTLMVRDTISVEKEIIAPPSEIIAVPDSTALPGSTKENNTGLKIP